MEKADKKERNRMVKILTLKKSTSINGTIINYKKQFFDHLFPFNELKYIDVKLIRYKSHDEFTYIKPTHQFGYLLKNKQNNMTEEEK